MKKPLLLSIILSWLALGSVWGAAPFPYKLQLFVVNPGNPGEQPRMLVTVNNVSDGLLAGPVLRVDKGFPFDSGTYVVRTADGTAIKVRPRSVSGPLVQQIGLIPESPLKAATEYTLEVADGQLWFVVGGVDTPNPPLQSKLPEESVDIAMKYATSQISENKISLLGGNVGGVASLRASLITPQFLNIEWLNVDLNGSADIHLNPDESTNFFNNIKGELRAWYPYTLMPEGKRPQKVEWFTRAKLESDQKFDNIDSLFGGGVGWFVNEPVSDWLGRRFVKDALVVRPLVIVSYDYVHQLEQKEAKNVDTGEESSRLSAILRWQVPIARNVTMGNLPGLGDKFDVDVDCELRGIYDSHVGKVLDQSWLTLVLTPKVNGPVKPALTFTWARGKAAPNFDQINALLAGLRVSF